MKKIILILLLLSITSCALISPNYALKKAGFFKTKNKLITITNKSQKEKILFLGMHHIGRKEYYDDVAKKIDSLQNLGYVVFYEGVKGFEETDSLVDIKNQLKLRKILGFSIKKHIDTATNIIGGRLKYKGKHKLINQPRYGLLKVDSLTAIWGDVSLNELITEFEKKHSKIKLDSCDFKIDLKNRDYKCKKVKKKLARNFRYKFILDYRDKHLANKIIESKKNKVLVVYGARHYSGLWWEFVNFNKSISKKDSTLIN